MAERLALKVITRADLRAPDYAKFWQWPEELPAISGLARDFLLNNPLAASDADPVQVVATTGTQVVGRVNLISGRVRVGSQDVDVLWGSGLEVAEPFRNTGAGLMLMLRMGSIAPAVCVVGISKVVTPLYEKLRWDIFPMKRHVLLRRSRPVLERFLGPGGATLARPLAGAMLSVHGGLLRSWNAVREGRFLVESLDTLPAELDPLLEASRASATCHRSSSWINWLLSHHAGMHRLHLVRVSGGPPLGYFTTTTKFHASASSDGFRNLTLGSVKDWVVFDSDAISELDLLLLATRELCRAPEVDAIEICLPEDDCSAALRRRGFLIKGDLKFLFKCSPQSPLSATSLRDRTHWWFRPADGDNFFF